MKHLILSFCILHSAFVIAAEPTIAVTSATSITIDGVSAGKPADAIANNPQIASAIQTALEQWAATEAAAKTKAESDLAALKQRIDIVLNGLLTEELKTGDGPRAQLLRDLIAQAGKSDADLKREALEAEIAAKKKQLESLK